MTSGFYSFQIKSKLANYETDVVYRRYSEFLTLHNNLLSNEKYLGHILPIIPPKEIDLWTKLGL